MKKEAQLLRSVSEDQGTPGMFWSKDFECHTLELPWRDNQPNMSCIPTGEYEVVPYRSKRFGECYKVLNVPGRTDILWHAGNRAGDKELGYKTDSKGCVLPGLTVGMIGGQVAVLSSRKALEALKEAMNYEAFKLKIIWQEGI